MVQSKFSHLTSKGKYLYQFTLPFKNTSADTLRKGESAIESMSDPIQNFYYERFQEFAGFSSYLFVFHLSLQTRRLISRSVLFSVTNFPKSSFTQSY